jgi:hypothetical protein
VINRKTVLIIGAGASAEFNMPLGSQLIKRVANAVTETRWENEPEAGSLLEQMRACLYDDRADRLYKLGPKLAEVAVKSKLPSMDEVLHFLADADVVYLGKLAISYEIMKAERESHLHLATSFHKERFIGIIDQSWANEFLGLALSGGRRQDLSNLFANVTVIDFNYDRVLPQYLYRALQRNLAIPEDDAAECVKNLSILHPYGSLGKLEWEAEKDTLPFGSSEGHLADVANRIRTYTEETQDRERRVQIQNAIDAAHVIIVVGFGYHRQNIQIITGTGEERRKRVFMTVYGITNDINNQVIRECMQLALRTERKYEHETAVVADTAQGMFRELRPALSLVV